MINDGSLDREINRLLDILYAKRFSALNKLSITKLLNKNPYLYRALGINDPDSFIEQLMIAFISSSDETIFGNDFFEPLAFWSARESAHHHGDQRTVTVGAGAGQDIAIETATAYLAISVKSSKNIFNAQSNKGQSIEFSELQARLKKLGKQFRPIIGYSYGRKLERPERKATNTEKIAGQKFWALLTGEDSYYLRIANSIGKFSTQHGLEYKEQCERKKNQILREFMINFVSAEGIIDWDKVVEFSSGSQKPSKNKM